MEKRQKSLSKPELEQRALALLSRRDHSVQQLRLKLLQLGGVKEEIEELLDLLSHKGYLDDARFARAFIRSRKGRGARRLRAELAERGVSSQTIGSALEEVERPDEEQTARELAETQFQRGKSRDTVARFLLRRGFAPGLCRSIIDDLAN